MFSPVSPVDAPRISPVQSGNIRRSDHKPRCDPCGNIIKYIVHLCRDAAEEQILLILISQHRVHRIDRFVQKTKRGPADHQIDQGSRHSVRSILRHRLHSRFCHALCAQILRIPPNDHGHCSAGAGKIPPFQPFIYPAALFAQASCRHDLITPESFQHKPQDGMELLRQNQYAKRHQK